MERANRDSLPSDRFDPLARIGEQVRPWGGPGVDLEGFVGDRGRIVRTPTGLRWAIDLEVASGRSKVPVENDPGV